MTDEFRQVKNCDQSKVVVPCRLCKIKQDSVAVILLESKYGLYSRLKDPDLCGAGIIIPLRHCESPFDLTQDEWAATRELLIRAKQLVDQQFQPAGYNIGWNCGEVGGQILQHVHLHLIPRFTDEPFAGKGIRHWFKLPENRRQAPKGTGLFGSKLGNAQND